MLTLDETSVNAPESLLETESCMVHKYMFHNVLRTLPVVVIGGAIDLLFLQWLYLQGSLKITQLENMPVKLYPGFKALKKMKGIESLGLYWRDDADHCCLNTNPEEESAFTRFQERKQNHSSKRQKSLIQPDARRIDVLECLMPHENLKRLLVKEYPGYSFPDWKPLIFLTSVELIDCGWCENLPTHGNHMFLNRLSLQGMYGVKHIGEEFYGESTSRPFPAPRELSLIDFPNLEEWFGPDGEDLFPSLTKLIINECQQLTMMPQIQSIQYLQLRDCCATLVHSFRNLTSLKVLAIQKAKDLSYFSGSFPAKNPFLTSLEIVSCPLLWSLPTVGTFTVLKSLTIRWCEKLSYLPNGMQNLNALEYLELVIATDLCFSQILGLLARVTFEHYPLRLAVI
nr:disease resistance protein RGA2-like [Ziziphus jujuba var. spinosa]